MTETSELETRVRRQEDRREIDDLVLLYCLVMDERDVAALPRLFTEDARLGSGDGVFAADGLAEIRRTYEGRFAALGPTFHYSHGVVVRFDEADPDLARGVATGHGEVVRNDTTMSVALRYQDTYRRTPAGWRFAERVLSYMYYMPAAEYVDGMRTADRNHAYGDERPADWPSTLHGGDLDWLRALTKD